MGFHYGILTDTLMGFLLIWLLAYGIPIMLTYLSYIRDSYYTYLLKYLPFLRDSHYDYLFIDLPY